MKQLRIVNGIAGNNRRFKENETDQSVLCSYRDRSCSPECAACQMDDKDESIAICSRGDFVIGQVFDIEIIPGE